MLTVPEVAARLGRSPETVRRWIRSGSLRAHKVGTQHLVDERDLAAHRRARAGRAAEASPPYAIPAVDSPPDRALLRRIALDPSVLAGKPIVRGTRISVEHVLSLLAAGWSARTIGREHPALREEDVRACLAYAAERLRDERLHALPPG